MLFTSNLAAQNRLERRSSCFVLLSSDFVIVTRLRRKPWQMGGSIVIRNHVTNATSFVARSLSAVRHQALTSDSTSNFKWWHRVQPGCGPHNVLHAENLRAQARIDSVSAHRAFKLSSLIDREICDNGFAKSLVFLRI